MLSFIYSNLLRSREISKGSISSTIMGAVINIVLDPIFISFLGWGVGGTVIATAIEYLYWDNFRHHCGKEK